MTLRYVTVLLAVALVPSGARAEGVQYVITEPLLDRLDQAQFEPAASRPLFVKEGHTAQSEWPGANQNHRVKVRRQVRGRALGDMRDCLALAVPGQVTFPVTFRGHTFIRMAPLLAEGSSGDLEVLIDQGGQSRSVWTTPLRKAGLSGDPWEEVQGDLGELQGEGRIILRAKGKGKALLAVPRLVTAQAEKKAPKMLLIFLDSLRADVVPPNRTITSVTPHIDRFAAKAVRFQNAFSVGNQTRIGTYSIFTGVPPSVGGFYSRVWSLPEAMRKAYYSWEPDTLARVMRRHGYMTIHAGYSGFVFPYQSNTLDLGFDVIQEYGQTPRNTERMSDDAIAYFREHKNDRFLYVLFYHPPHYGSACPSGYAKRAKELAGDTGGFSPEYLGKVIHGDEHLGRVLKAIEDMGLDKETLILFTADHGEAMDPAHQGYSKNVNCRVVVHHGKTFYNEETHVPLLMSLPGVLSSNITVDQAVSHLDVIPTLLDVAGLPPSDKLVGKSFLGLARGEREAEDRVIYSEGRWSYAVQKGKAKYIYHEPSEKLTFNSKTLYRGPGPDELFDLATDPKEHVSVAHDPAYAGMLKEIKGAYRELRDRLRAFRGKHIPGEAPAPLRPLGE